ncbi:hypothetical protein QJQ45_014192 [Haematococcus lacustris]|nr:hypothetical protein QJQ45_014192 [Haematococcus lacustris]
MVVCAAWRAAAQGGGPQAPAQRSGKPQSPPSLDPLPFHLVNVLLHAAVSALVCSGTLQVQPHQLSDAPWPATEDAAELTEDIPRSVQCAPLPLPLPLLPDPKLDRSAKLLATREPSAAAGSSQPVCSALYEQCDPDLDLYPDPDQAGMGVTSFLLLHLHLPSWATGLAFAAHPVHTEAVAGCVGMAELLAALCCLTALMWYCRLADGDAAWPQARVQQGQQQQRHSQQQGQQRQQQGQQQQQQQQQQGQQQQQQGQQQQQQQRQQQQRQQQVKKGQLGQQEQHLGMQGQRPWPHIQPWLEVTGALLLALAGALCKEIGITVLGAMVAYDALLVPWLPTPGWPCGEALAQFAAKGVSCDPGDALSDTARGCPAAKCVATSEAASDTHGTSVMAPSRGRLTWLLLHPKTARLALTLVVAGGYVALRGAVAGDQLVRIYRKVENPLPFIASPLMRGLSTVYLHTLYVGLLVWPSQLSCDWSHPCVPLIERLDDPRNARSAVLLLVLLLGVLMARPWAVLRAAWQQAGWAVQQAHPSPLADRLDPSPDVLMLQPPAPKWRWRLAVGAGLLIGPFFPASNILCEEGPWV